MVYDLLHIDISILLQYYRKIYPETDLPQTPEVAATPVERVKFSYDSKFLKYFIVFQVRGCHGDEGLVQIRDCL